MQNSQNIYSGILYEILVNNQTDYSIVTQTNKHDSTIAHPNDKYLYINKINHVPILCEPANYELIQNELMYDLNLEFDKWNNRNIYTSNQLPQQIMDYIENRYKFKQNDPRFETLLQIFNKLTFRIPTLLTNSEELRDNIPAMFASYQNEFLYEYVTEGKKTEFSTPKHNLNYKIVKISKDLEHKISHIDAYFTELKDVLVFDQNTGYYFIKIDGENVPVLCRHLYLLFSGVSDQEISLECYKDGKCKYCGEEIRIYNENAKMVISSQVYSMIYSFLDCIKDSVNDTLFWNYIINNIHEEIVLNNLKINETEMLAFCGIYLLKLQKETEEFIQYYKSRVMSFKSTVRIINADLGRSTFQINSILEQPGVFKTINKLTQLLKDNVLYSNSVNADMLPFAVLFEDSNFFIGSPLPSKMNTVQTLYVNGKMYELIDKFNDIRNKQWSFSPFYLKNKYSTDIYIRNFKEEKDTLNNLEFFKNTCKNYCPMSTRHEFKRSTNTCVHCGLKNDFSNYKEIFNEFKDIIINSYVKNEEYDENKWKINSLYSIDKLNEYNEKLLFVKYIPSEQISFNNILLKNMLEADEETNEKARVYLASIYRKSINEIPTDNKLIVKLFCKAGEQNLVPTSLLLENLQYIYANIKNIVQLIPSVRAYKKGSTDEEIEEDEVLLLDDYDTVEIE